MTKTTNLKHLRAGNPFTWGTITRLFDIGPYSIAQYIDHDDVMHYHVWVDGEDTCQGCATLEEAMVYAVAYQAEGANTRAADYFMRMICHPCEGKR